MTAPRPAMLEGMRIVDMTSVVFGPYATQMLADLGADVIKVETPEGDTMRRAGRPKATPGMSPAQMLLNRGKRSMMLDLKAPADADCMRALLATADVFIHNVRAGAIDRLGFGYAAVEALRPHVIYVHCVGFGSGGPYAGLQAYDDVIQAATGATTLLPRVDGNPQPRYLPSLVADKVAGLYAAQATLAAIIHRERSGRGQFVEVPMFESFAQFILQEHLFGQVFEDPVEPAGYPRQIDPNRQPFPTADGHISIVPYTIEAIVRLFDVLGAPEVMKQERFATPQAMMRNITDLYGEIARLTRTKPSAHWVAAFKAAQLPCMPVCDLADIRRDPHLQAVDFFHRRTHPTEGGYVEMRLPVRFSDYAPGEALPPAALGAHTDEIRATLKRTP